MANILVLGIGNILNHDEGVGVYAVRALRERIGDVPGLTLHDGGALGLNLLPLVDDATHLLILDAVAALQVPGTVIERTGDQIPKYNQTKMSEHQLSFQEVLGLAMFRDTLPKHLHLIGMQPADLSVGVGLSPQATAALPELVDRAIALLARWGLDLHQATPHVSEVRDVFTNTI